MAQSKLTLESLIPPAPNAAEIGKYGTMPVSTQTGIPDISFPLYEIKSGSLKLPITLTYHAAGNQVNQKSTDVGLGWSINAGAQISRTVYGAKDDSQYGYFNYTPPTYSQLMAINNYYTMEFYGNHAYDLEPDLFVYNLAGKSGKFIYGLNNQFQTIPFDPIVITKINMAGYNVSFQIVDDNGTQYQFQNYASVVSDYNSSKTTRNTWYLTNMISNTLADTIHFTYETAYYDDQLKQQSYPIGKEVVCGVNNLPVLNFVNGATGGLANDVTIETHYNELLIYKITSSDGTVEFKRNTVRQDDLNNNRMLDEIVVTNSNNQVIKRIALNHDYFLSTIYNTDYDRKRLKLTGYNESAVDPSTKLNYVFDYNSTPLPGFGKYSTDYWGYYNGMDLNWSYIPSTTVYASEINSVTFLSGETFNNGFINLNESWTIGDANREPDANYMRACILSKVTYPTGGYTLYDFEPNQYLSDLYPNPTKIGGGLRIKSVKHYDVSNTLTQQQEYKYGVGENGLGIKIFNERNFYRNYEDIAKAAFDRSSGGACNLGDGSHWLRNFLGFSKYNTLNYMGLPILYSTVTVYNGDQNNNLGKTVYTYNVIPESTVSPDEFSNSGNYGAINSNWHQGELAKIVTYSRSGGQYVPVLKLTNEYSLFNQSSINAIQIRQSKQFAMVCNVCSTDPTGPSPSNPKPGQGYFSIYPYLIPTGASRKTKETKVTYSLLSTADSTTEVNIFKYDNPLNRYLTETTTTLNEPGASKIFRLKYPQDKSDAIFTAMVSKNILTPVVEEKTLKSVNGNETLLSTIQTNYKQVFNAYVPDYIMASTGNALLEKRIQFNQYDFSGNIQEQQKVNDIKEVYLWSYKNHYPVARIMGSDYATVSSLLSQSTIDAANGSDVSMRSLFSNLRSSLPLAQIYSYTYALLVGMTSQTDPNNVTTFYDYDSQWRLKNIRDKDQNMLSRYYYHYYNDPKADVATLSTNVNYISYPYTASTSPVNITANCPWGVSSNASWLTASPTTGNGNGILNLSAIVNPSTTSSRTGQVTITYGNNQTLILTISQDYNASTLSVDQSYITMGKYQDYYYVNVSSNTSWTVSNPQSWLYVSPSSGGTGNLQISLRPQRLSTGTRTGTVTLTTTNGAVSVAITVFQDSSIQ